MFDYYHQWIRAGDRVPWKIRLYAFIRGINTDACSGRRYFLNRAILR